MTGYYIIISSKPTKNLGDVNFSRWYQDNFSSINMWKKISIETFVYFGFEQQTVLSFENQNYLLKFNLFPITVSDFFFIHKINCSELPEVKSCLFSGLNKRRNSHLSWKLATIKHIEHKLKAVNVTFGYFAVILSYILYYMINN